MAITAVGKPGGVMAFAPSYLILKADAGEESTPLTFNDLDGNTHTLTVYFDASGYSYVDLQYIARVMFKAEEVVLNLKCPFPATPNNDFTVNWTGGSYTTTSVVLGAYEVGDETMPPKLIRFAGYPFTFDVVSFLFDTDNHHWFANDVDIWVTYAGGLATRVVKENDGGRRVATILAPTKIWWKKGDDIGDITTIETRGCYDKNAVYVRFVDHMGRLRYWLFNGNSATFAADIEDRLTKPFMPTYDTLNSVWQKVPRILNRELQGDTTIRHAVQSKQIKCTAFGLPADEAALVAEIVSSPRVDMYVHNVSTPYWVNVSNVSCTPTADARKNTNIEMTFTITSKNFPQW